MIAAVEQITNSSVLSSVLVLCTVGMVKLTTLNIALLGRQPKLCEIFFFS